MKKRLLGGLSVGALSLGLLWISSGGDQAQARCGPNGIYCACTNIANWDQAGVREQVGTGPVNTGTSRWYLRKPAFGIDTNNVLYLATNETAGSTYRTSVYRYNGTWQRIGIDANFSAVPNLGGDYDLPSLDIDASNNVYVVSFTGHSTGSLSTRLLALYKYSASSSTWTLLGIHGPAYITFPQVRVTSTGVAHIVYRDQNSNLVAVRNQGSSFVSLGIVNTGSTGGVTQWFDSEMDQHNDYYVSYINLGNGGVNVKKYTNNARQNIGSQNLTTNGLRVDLLTMTGVITGATALRVLVDKNGTSQLFGSGTTGRSILFSTGTTGSIYGSLGLHSQNYEHLSFNGRDSVYNTFAGHLRRLYLSPYASAPVPGGYYGVAALEMNPNDVPYVAIQKTSSTLEVRRINCPTAPLNGSCGSAHHTPTYTSPNNYLCTAGTPTSVVRVGDTWTWSCQGDNGGTNASCDAPVIVDGVCGEADGGLFNTTPHASLRCSVGTWSNMQSFARGWTRRCNGINGGQIDYCQAYKNCGGERC